MSFISYVLLGFLAFFVVLWFLFHYILPFILSKYLKKIWDETLRDNKTCHKPPPIPTYQRYLWFDDDEWGF